MSEKAKSPGQLSLLGLFPAAPVSDVSSFVDPEDPFDNSEPIPSMPDSITQSGNESERPALGSYEEALSKRKQSMLESGKVAPMMRHYLKVKAQYADHVVLYQVGDFYEIFFEDAHLVSSTLNIRLTSRDKDQANPVPMCGIPVHALDSYLPRLIAAGYSCVVFSQAESAAEAKGIIKRQVTRVVTPGVRFEGDGLDERKFNYLAAMALTARETGFIVFVDVSTGHLRIRRLEELDDMVEALQRVQPSEIILPSTIAGISLQESTWLSMARRICRAQGCHIVQRPFDRVTRERLKSKVEAFLKREAAYQSALRVLNEIDTDGLTVVAAVLDYVEEMAVGRVPQLAELSIEEQSSVVLIDQATRRNLELLETRIDGSRKYSLIGQLDSTETAMGARLFAEWILSPSSRLEVITARHEAVEELYQNPTLLADMRLQLAKVRDLDRLASRITSGRANPRDLQALLESCAALPEFKMVLEKLGSALLAFLREGFDCLTDIGERLTSALADEPPTKITEGGIFKEGFHQELDRLRNLSRDAKQWIADFEARERTRTDISGLKVRYNNIFGYYIEITKTHLAKVPSDYERKQTLVNAERYVTRELKEQEQAVLSARTRQVELEKELFLELRNWVAEQASRIQAVAQVLAVLDVLGTFAQTARQFNYVRPEIFSDGSTQIVRGRHPVVEQVVGQENFVANDTFLDSGVHRFAVLTGPNMGGKSTYLRQVGLVQLLAQAGSFVPAQSAKLSLVDRIFTRIGAADDLTRGDSTFMVEMREAAIILRRASERSLVLIDEVGRGTATTDGLAIATAIAEYLLNSIGCRTVFATHFHELVEFAEHSAGAFCLSVGVEEKGDEIFFTHRIEEAPGDRSYGIEVARLAGLPQQVLFRASEVLRMLDHSERQDAVVAVTKGVVEPEIGSYPYSQQEKFEKSGLDPRQMQVLQRMRELDLNRLTPLESLLEFSRLQSLLTNTSEDNSI